MFVALFVGNNVYAQNQNDVTLIVSADGDSKEEATKVALRSAIEQAYGTFVSANTTILNDELVQDEIVTVASGNIKDYKEITCKQMPNGKMLTTDAPIILHGHSHKYTACVEKDVLNITIPALSKVAMPIPSCLELNVEFDKGYINNAIVKNIYFGKNSDMILSEINFDLSNRAIVRTAPINVENYKDKANKVLKKTIPILSKKEHQLSQVDKFNKRYGNK